MEKLDFLPAKLKQNLNSLNILSRLLPPLGLPALPRGSGLEMSILSYFHISTKLKDKMLLTLKVEKVKQREDEEERRKEYEEWEGRGAGEGRREEEDAGCLGRAALGIREPGMWKIAFLSTHLCLVWKFLLYACITLLIKNFC